DLGEGGCKGQGRSSVLQMGVGRAAARGAALELPQISGRSGRLPQGRLQFGRRTYRPTDYHRNRKRTGRRMNGERSGPWVVPARMSAIRSVTFPKNPIDESVRP